MTPPAQDGSARIQDSLASFYVQRGGGGDATDIYIYVDENNSGQKRVWRIKFSAGELNWHAQSQHGKTSGMNWNASWKAGAAQHRCWPSLTLLRCHSLSQSLQTDFKIWLFSQQNGFWTEIFSDPCQCCVQISKNFFLCHTVNSDY